MGQRLSTNSRVMSTTITAGRVPAEMGRYSLPYPAALYRCRSASGITSSHGYTAQSFSLFF